MKQIKQLIFAFFAKFGYFIGKLPQHNKKDLELYSDEVCYNIGAGHYLHPKWLNIDKKNDTYKACRTDVNIDFRELKSFPIKNNSVDLYYSSHCIEHLRDHVVLFLFRQIYRTLKTGGIFRVTCPNMELYYLDYKRNDYQFLDEHKKSFNRPEYDYLDKKYISYEQILINLIVSSTSTMINADSLSDDVVKFYLNKQSMGVFFDTIYGLYDESHKVQEHVNWFTHEKLIQMLKSSGFKKIIISGQGQSIEKKMRNPYFFDTTFPKRSLFIECIK